SCLSTISRKFPKRFINCCRRAHWRSWIMRQLSNPIIFFGSGPVAAESLRQLEPHVTFEAVITKPKPEHHRDEFPMLEVAGALGLPMFTPNSTKELTELFTKLELDSKAGLVIDYGFIIEKPVID